MPDNQRDSGKVSRDQVQQGGVVVSREGEGQHSKHTSHEAQKEPQDFRTDSTLA